MLKSEFVVADAIRSNQSGPVRWLVSHLQRNIWLVVVSFLGAFGNAALASAVPIYAGQAFNAARGDVVNLRAILVASLLMVGTQLVRSLLQLARNTASIALTVYTLAVGAANRARQLAGVAIPPCFLRCGCLATVAAGRGNSTTCSA